MGRREPRDTRCEVRGARGVFVPRHSYLESSLRRYRHEFKRPGDVTLQIAPVYYGVQHSVLEQEFAPLKSLGQLLADGLLDDARSGEADQSAGFGDVQVAQHG